MRFSIPATLFSLALATLGLAAPTNPSEADIGQRSTDVLDVDDPYDWKTKYGWDGKITPIEEIGEDVSPVSIYLLFFLSCSLQGEGCLHMLISGYVNHFSNPVLVLFQKEYRD